MGIGCIFGHNYTNIGLCKQYGDTYAVLCCQKCGDRILKLIDAPVSARKR